jgi:hypothetical protein
VLLEYKSVTPAEVHTELVCVFRRVGSFEKSNIFHIAGVVPVVGETCHPRRALRAPQRPRCPSNDVGRMAAVQDYPRGLIARVRVACGVPLPGVVEENVMPIRQLHRRWARFNPIVLFPDAEEACLGDERLAWFRGPGCQVIRLRDENRASTPDQVVWARLAD